MRDVSRRTLSPKPLAAGLLSTILAVGCAADLDEEDLDELMADMSAGPFVDADQQLAEVRDAQLRSNGTWASAPEPGTKAKSPETDLRNYPKFTDKQDADQPEEEQHAAPQSSSAESVDVVSIEILPDGSTSFSIYDPAPGVTPEELAEVLRRQGKTGVQLVRHEVTINAPNDCAFGQARSSRCPVAFWTNNGFEDPLVRFNDHSGAAWPTDNAVFKWNQVANIDSAYRWNSCPFQAGARCVDVVSGNFAAGWTGRFSALFPPGQTSGPFQEHGQVIQLNDRITPQGWTRNNTVTHEMGHALGLGHNTWSGDVMYEFANMREDIGGENRVLLESIYSIPR